MSPILCFPYHSQFWVIISIFDHFMLVWMVKYLDEACHSQGSIYRFETYVGNASYSPVSSLLRVRSQTVCQTHKALARWWRNTGLSARDYLVTSNSRHVVSLSILFIYLKVAQGYNFFRVAKMSTYFFITCSSLLHSEKYCRHYFAASQEKGWLYEDGDGNLL